MSGQFISAGEVDRQVWEGAGDLGFISTASPSTAMVFVDLIMAPGEGFGFHLHPDQEEVIYVVEGTFEAWIGEECRTISSGDSMHMPAGTVHACHNVSDAPAKMFVALSPRLEGEDLGFSMVDVSGDEPWASLRG